MTLTISVIIAVSVFFTAVISGTFGLAGGMILMVVLLQLLPVAAAMSLHALIQLVSNGWRCFLWRKYIVWHVFPFYGLGMAAGLAIVMMFGFVPNKVLVFLVIGALPFLSILVKKNLVLTIMNRSHAFCSAIFLTFIHMTGGVVGVLLDFLFNNTDLTRQQIVATKAFMQTCSHLLRLLYFGAFVALVTGQSQGLEELSRFFVLLFLFLSIIGNTAAAYILHKLNDYQFKTITGILIAIISAYCLFRGGWLLLSPYFI